MRRPGGRAVGAGPCRLAGATASTGSPSEYQGIGAHQEEERIIDPLLSGCRATKFPLFLPELCSGKNTLRRSRSAALAPTNEAKAEAMERAYFPWKPNEVGSMLYAALPFGQGTNRTLVLYWKV